ncbi:MAG: hypothetical protein HYZ42_18960, partial [Bacteroidetes bacterium]|nr:hypothetical protein [Bacteroidota bacterium]
MMKKNYFMLLFCLSQMVLFAQTPLTNLGTDITGSYTNYTNTVYPAFKQTRVKETSGTSSGTRKWEWNSDGYYNTWRASSNQTIVGYNQIISPNSSSASAYFRASYGGTSAFLPGTTTNSYYTFNVTYSGTVYRNEYMSVLETNFNPATISGMTVTFVGGGGSYGSTNVTLSSVPTLSSGEILLCRYSTDGYGTSSLIQVNPSGGSATCIIPAQTAGANVSFYFYTSNKGISIIQSAVSAVGQLANDLFTLNLQNNGGSNYTYTQPNNNVIVNSSGGTITPTGYSTLKAAFDAINAGTHTGTMTLGIFGNTTETAQANLNASGSGSASYTSIGIQPVGGSRVISASAISGYLVHINGGDNITIDGVGKTLTFRNTHTSAASCKSTIMIDSGATADTIRNCIVENNSSVSTEACLSIGAQTNQVYINNNNLRDATGGTTGSCATGIYSNSSSNTLSVISNDIFNFTAGGMLGNLVASGCVITGNSVYNSYSLSGLNVTGLQLNSGDGHTISNNYIGGTAANCGGTAFTISGASTSFRPIYISNGSTTNTTSIFGNVIQNISMSGGTAPKFFGIVINGGKVQIGNTYTNGGNIVGHASTANSIQVGSGSASGIINAIYMNTTVSANQSICGNTIANLTIGGTGSASNLYGVNFNQNGSSSLSPDTVSNNTIKNLTTPGTSTGGTSTCVLAGINISNLNTTPVIVDNNIINGLSATTTSAVATNVRGIVMGGANSSVLVRKNKIYGLSNTATGTTP